MQGRARWKGRGGGAAVCSEHCPVGIWFVFHYKMDLSKSTHVIPKPPKSTSCTGFIRSKSRASSCRGCKHVTAMGTHCCRNSLCSPAHCLEEHESSRDPLGWARTNTSPGAVGTSMSSELLSKRRGDAPAPNQLQDGSLGPSEPGNPVAAGDLTTAGCGCWSRAGAELLVPLCHRWRVLRCHRPGHARLLRQGRLFPPGEGLRARLGLGGWGCA